MKLNLKNIALFVFGVSGCFSAFAQQEAQFTQYMYNTSTINPAYAGSRDGLSIFGQYRSQWVGLEGAPQTGGITFHTPINYSKLGIGVSVMNDKLGAMTDNTVAVDVSYTIETSSTYKLALGVKASGNFLNVDYDKLNIYDLTEGTENIDNQFTANIGAGAYLYSEKTYFGVSIPFFLEQDRAGDNQYASMKKTMQVYAMAGHVFDLSRDIKFKPALLTKIIQITIYPKNKKKKIKNYILSSRFLTIFNFSQENHHKAW